MRPEELLDVMGELNPDYVEEAERYVGNRKDLWKKAAALTAACLCVVIVGVTANSLKNFYSEGTKSTGSTEEAGELEKETFTLTPAAIYVDGVCYERVEEAQKMEDAQEPEKMQTVPTEKKKLGELGEKGSKLYADSGQQGIEVYRIDKTQIVIEIDGEQVIYKKK